MRERFGSGPSHETAQDAQEAVMTAMLELMDLVRIDDDSRHTFRIAYPPTSTPQEDWSAKYTPQQYTNMFPQLDVSVSRRSDYAPDAPERRLIPTDYYDLMLDMGLSDKVQDMQFGADTTYRYLYSAEGVLPGVSYRPFMVMDGEKYFIPNGKFLGFRTLPEHITDRSKLTDMEMDVAAIDEADSARVVMAVEWFKHP